MAKVCRVASTRSLIESAGQNPFLVMLAAQAPVRAEVEKALDLFVGAAV